LINGKTPEDNVSFDLEHVDVKKGKATGQFPPAVAAFVAAIDTYFPVIKEVCLKDVEKLRQYIWKKLRLEELKKKDPGSCKYCNVGGDNIRFCKECENYYCSNTFKCHEGLYGNQCGVCKKTGYTASKPSWVNDVQLPNDARVWGKDNQLVNTEAKRETPAWVTWVNQQN